MGSKFNNPNKGEFKSWHEDGKRWTSGQYRYHTPSGRWTYWDTNGELFIITNYSKKIKKKFLNGIKIKELKLDFMDYQLGSARNAFPSYFWCF